MSRAVAAGAKRQGSGTTGLRGSLLPAGSNVPSDESAAGRHQPRAGARRAETIAVSRYGLGSPRHQGVAIFDAGVARTTTAVAATSMMDIEFGSSAATLYGYSRDTADAGFRRMAVDAAGVTTTDVSQLFAGPLTAITYAAGRVYDTDGRVVDPAAPALVGRFPVEFSRAMVPAPEDGRAWTVGSGSPESRPRCTRST